MKPDHIHVRAGPIAERLLRLPEQLLVELAVRHADVVGRMPVPHQRRAGPMDAEDELANSWSRPLGARLQRTRRDD